MPVQLLTFDINCKACIYTLLIADVAMAAYYGVEGPNEHRKILKVSMEGVLTSALAY